MNQQLLLSYIIPLYNCPDRVERCIQSMLQTPLPEEQYEIIVVNDGSTDHSPQVIKELIDRNPLATIRLLHQENKGIGGARNTGLRAAQGTYVWFIDADDYILPARLPQLLQFLQEKTPLILMFEFEYRYEPETQRPDLPLAPESLNLWGIMDARHFVAEKMQLSHSTGWRTFYNRQFLLERGYSFPERIYYEDFPFVCLTLFHVPADRFAYCSVAPYCYVIHSSSVVRNPELHLKRLDDRLISLRLTIENIVPSSNGVYKAQQRADEPFFLPAQAKVFDKASGLLLNTLRVAAYSLSYSSCQEFYQKAFTGDWTTPLLSAAPPQRVFLLKLARRMPNTFITLCRFLLPKIPL